MHHFGELTDCHFSLTGAAGYLGKSPRWLQYQLTGPNPPPGYKLGKCWVFKKSELDCWLKQFRAGVDLEKIVDEVVSDLEVAK